ncbi:Thioesterase [Minicystis rosea]|nr:Thioesterase [Minicystis rosea]
MSELIPAILPLLDRPFAFFGHSLGAFVAFETARALRQKGAPLPQHLLLGGCPAPQTHVVEQPIHALDDKGLVEALRRYQGTPDEVMKNEELMKLVLPLLRADFTLYETYAPPVEPPLDVPLTVLGGLDDDHATREELDGWRMHTTKAFLLRMFPGGHFFVHTARSQVLGTVLQDLAPHLR